MENKKKKVMFGNKQRNYDCVLYRVQFLNMDYLLYQTFNN